MSTLTAPPPAATRPFVAFAGSAALMAAVANLGYATSFLVVRPDNPDEGGTLASAFLLAGGVLAVPVLLALYRLLRDREPDFALLALVLGLVGSLGAAIHGGYDLANAINAPEGGVPDLPNQVDPRGLLTFGLTSLSLLVLAWLLARARTFPAGLARLAGVLGALLLLVYALRLTVLDADSAAIVAPAALAGFVVSPAWYAWLGVHLRRTVAG